MLTIEDIEKMVNDAINESSEDVEHSLFRKKGTSAYTPEGLRHLSGQRVANNTNAYSWKYGFGVKPSKKSEDDFVTIKPSIKRKMEKTREGGDFLDQPDESEETLIDYANKGTDYVFDNVDYVNKTKLSNTNVTGEAKDWVQGAVKKDLVVVETKEKQKSEQPKTSEEKPKAQEKQKVQEKKDQQEQTAKNDSSDSKKSKDKPAKVSSSIKDVSDAIKTTSSLFEERKGSKVVRKEYPKLSDQELREKINRKKLENEYSDIIGDTKYMMTGKEKVKNLLSKISTGVLAGSFIASAVEKAKEWLENR